MYFSTERTHEYTRKYGEAEIIIFLSKISTNCNREIRTSELKNYFKNSI